MTIDQIQNEVIDEFSDLNEWMEKYNHLIESGKSIPLINSKLKTEENLIQGCQSRVWLSGQLVSGKVVFTADSDAIITKGIAALLIRILGDHTPVEILNADLFFIEKIGLNEHLSPTRSNGMLSMIKQMKYYALAFQMKQKENQ